MSRLNLLLLLAVLASAAYLVRTSYESRRLFAAVEHERAESRQLASETERLQVERRAQATHLRVDRMARERLGMNTATPAVTQYVEDPLPSRPQIPAIPEAAASTASANAPARTASGASQ